MGNDISRIHSALEAAPFAHFEAEREDTLRSAAAPLPANYWDATSRLADVGIALGEGQRFGVREGSDTHHRLRDALMVVSQLAAGGETAAKVPSEERFAALGMLLRMDLLESFIPSKPMVLGDKVLLPIAPNLPRWLAGIFTQTPAPENRLTTESGDTITFRKVDFDRDDLSELANLPLHAAALKGDSATMAELLAAGLDPNAQDSRGRTPLHAAATRGEPTTAKLLLQAGADPNAADNKGGRAIDLAIHLDNAQVITALIRQGVSLCAPGAGGFTPLSRAAMMGRANIIDQLLNAGADVNHGGSNTTPLHHAVLNGEATAVAMLLKRGADPHRPGDWGLFQPAARQRGDAKTQVSPLEIAVLAGSVKCVKLLERAGVNLAEPVADGTLPLCLAAAAGDMNMLNLILEARAPIDARDDKGRTALLWAAGHGHLDAMRRLINKGAQADVLDARDNTVLHATAAGNTPDNGARKAKMVAQLLGMPGVNINARNMDSETALHMAAVGNEGEVMEALLKGRPELEARDHNGLTALHRAAGSGNLSALEALIRARAKECATDNLGNTALHMAAHVGAVPEMRALLLWGASATTRNKNRATPLHAAAQSGSVEAVELLLGQDGVHDTPGPNGLTAQDIARQRGHRAVAQRLADAGTNTSGASTR